MRIISSKSFRWSSPLRFNDPFDHQIGFVLKFGQDQFVERLTSSLERIIFSEVSPVRRAVSLFSDSPFYYVQSDTDFPGRKFSKDYMNRVLSLPRTWNAPLVN